MFGIKHPLSILVQAIATCTFLAGSYAQNITDVHLKVNLKNVAARNKTAPNLYGLFFEDINVNCPHHDLSADAAVDDDLETDTNMIN